MITTMIIKCGWVSYIITQPHFFLSISSSEYRLDINPHKEAWWIFIALKIKVTSSANLEHPVAKGVPQKNMEDNFKINFNNRSLSRPSLRRLQSSCWHRQHFKYFKWNAMLAAGLLISLVSNGIISRIMYSELANVAK